MRFVFECRGNPVVYDQVDSVVAVYPDPLFRGEDTPRGVLKRLHMTRARDDSHGPSAALPARSRRIFEKAGWVFAKARPRSWEAAQTRTPLQEKADVRPVYKDAGGNILLGTSCLAVELKPEIRSDAAEELLRLDDLTIVRALRFGTNLFEVSIPPGLPVQEIVSRLKARPEYVFVEPSFLEAIPGRNNPDPDLRKQWHHENPEGNGADIKSKLAWEKTRGAKIRIAVIDNGMQVTHPDLVNRIVSGGYFDSDGTCGGEFHPLQRGEYFPDDTHGTFCMGLAAAEKDNGIHGCGVAPEANLMAIACRRDQLGTQITLARAVAFAADPTVENAALTVAEGADVLSCSLGPESGYWQMWSVLERAIRFAASTGRAGRGLPIFWAVGNSPVDIVNDEVCSHPDVIAIGQSSDSDFEVGGAYGERLAFVAPGYYVYSITSEGSFVSLEGASYACPVAAGVAALVLDQYPQWTRNRLRRRMLASCDRIGDPLGGYVKRRHRFYGHGRINAACAVR